MCRGRALGDDGQRRDRRVALCGAKQLARHVLRQGTGDRQGHEGFGGDLAAVFGQGLELLRRERAFGHEHLRRRGTKRRIAVVESIAEHGLEPGMGADAKGCRQLSKGVVVSS